MFILRMFFMYWQTGEQVARMIWPLGESRIKAALAATKTQFIYSVSKELRLVTVLANS